MVNKRDIVNLTSKFIAFAMNLIINFFVSSFVIKTVGEEAYGFVGLANDFVSYAQIISIALNSMASRFITIEYEKKNNKSVNEYFSSLLFMNIILAVFFGLLGSLIIINLQNIIHISTNNLFDVKLLWFFILLNLQITLVGTVFSVSTFCKKRLELEALRSSIGMIIKAVVLVLCYVFLEAYICYIGVATVVSTIYSVIYNIKYTKILMPDVDIRKEYYSKEKIMTLVKAGGWNSFTKIGTILSDSLDLLVTNLFVNPASMGIMSIAKIIPKYFHSLIVSLSSAFSPSFVIAFAKGKVDDLVEYIKSSIRIFSVFTITPLVLITTLAGNIYILWVPTMNIQYLVYITIIGSVGYLAVMPFESVWIVYTSFNKIKWSSIYLILESLFNIIIELLLIQYASTEISKMLIIVGVTSFLMVVRALFFLPIYTKKCIGKSCSFMYLYFIKNLFLFSTLTFAGYRISALFVEKTWISLIISSIVIGTISMLFSLYIILNHEERKRIIIKIKERIKKKL